MKLSNVIILCCSLAATSPSTLFGNGAEALEQEHEIHDLHGAVQTSLFVEFDTHQELSADSTYTYRFRMDLSTPLSTNYDGTPTIDSCIRWENGVSSTNFTWYGISFQLPENAKKDGGSWATAPAQSEKENGYIQLLNETDLGVARYNFTTSTIRPVIRARVNDGMFWETLTFDFSDEASDYLEHKLGRTVLCIVGEAEDGSFRRYNYFAEPTMTVSLELLKGPIPTPDPNLNSSFMARTLFAIVNLTTSVVLLMLS